MHTRDEISSIDNDSDFSRSSIVTGDETRGTNHLPSVMSQFGSSGEIAEKTRHNARHFSPIRIEWFIKKSELHFLDALRSSFRYAYMPAGINLARLSKTMLHSLTRDSSRI